MAVVFARNLAMLHPSALSWWARVSHVALRQIEKSLGKLRVTERARERERRFKFDVRERAAVSRRQGKKLKGKSLTNTARVQYWLERAHTRGRRGKEFDDAVF